MIKIIDNAHFWTLADELVATSEIIIDRPRGSVHPRMSDLVYPLDYGYLSNTGAVDGAGVDVWRGSLPELRVTGAVATVDVYKRDAEVKLLVGCTPEEAQIVFNHANRMQQSGLLFLRQP